MRFNINFEFFRAPAVKMTKYDIRVLSERIENQEINPRTGHVFTFPPSILLTHREKHPDNQKGNLMIIQDIDFGGSEIRYEGAELQCFGIKAGKITHAPPNSSGKQSKLLTRNCMVSNIAAKSYELVVIETDANKITALDARKISILSSNIETLKTMDPFSMACLRIEKSTYHPTEKQAAFIEKQRISKDRAENQFADFNNRKIKIEQAQQAPLKIVPLDNLRVS